MGLDRSPRTMTAWRIIVGQQDQMLDPFGHGHLRQPIRAERCPDRNPEQDVRRPGRLPAFGETQNIGRGSETDGGAEWPTEQTLGRIEIIGWKPGAGIKKQTLEGDDAGVGFESGKQRRAEAGIGASAKRHMIMVSQCRVRSGEAAHHRIYAGRCIGDRVRRLPERAEPANELTFAAIGIHQSSFSAGRRDRQSIGTERAHDIDRCAAREAFEEDTTLTDPDREAWTMIVMCGAATHDPAGFPCCAQRFDDPGSGGVQARIRTGPGEGHKECSG